MKVSPPRHPDTIMDFNHRQGDKIDLYSLRAFVPGSDPLAFIGSQTFAQLCVLGRLLVPVTPLDPLRRQPLHRRLGASAHETEFLRPKGHPSSIKNVLRGVGSFIEA